VRRYLGRGAKQRTEGLDVSTAFRMLAEAANRQGNVPVSLQLDEKAASQVTSEASLHLLQIAREAVSNAARHSGASCITLRLHPHGDQVELSVEDDGAGFDPASTHGPGYGLGNMRARAAEIGAEFELDSRPGAGARLSVRLSTASGHTSGVITGPTNGVPRMSAEVPA
jgi:signal transduction histidine kinase